MSLQLIAKEMEAKGRKGDSMLVHMTPGEVAGLQKLAESAGGSLSVNPDTGLVEANFLKQMLPTLVGAGVGFFSANPLLGAAAGAAVGGYQANRAGRDVGSGMLMGGLGGYGGQTLSMGFQAAGAPAVVGAAPAGAPTATDASTKLLTNAAVNTLAGGVAPTTAPAQTPFFNEAQQRAVSDTYGFGPFATPPTIAAGAGSGANTTPSLVVNPNTQTNAPPPPAAPMGFLDRARSGFAGMENAAGRAAALKAMGGSEGVIQALMMAGLPAMYGARTKVPHPYGLLSADINKRGFAAAEGGEVGFFSGGGTGQGNGLLSSLMGNSAYENRKFIIDPATGNVIRNPNLPPPAATTFANMTGSDGGGGGIAPNPDFDTPEKQRAYYAENPTMANITGLGQEIFGMTPLGIAQNAIAPDFVAAQRAMVTQADAPVDTRTKAIDSPLGMGLQSTDFGAPSGINLGPDEASLAAAKAHAEYERDQYAAMAAAVRDNIGLSNSDAFSQQAGERDSSRDGMGGASEGSAGSTAATADSPDGPDGANAYAGGSISLASGGLMGLARGGMRSGGFVIPADVVSMVGEGNTDAGYKRIKAMVPSATAIKGKDGGQSDTVKTSIEGKQRARVAHGEMYIPPETVKRLGGAKKLYAMMDRVRQQATGSKKQIKPVSLKRAMA
jgi:hypothetical protein